MRSLLVVLALARVASAERFDDSGPGGFVVAAGAGVNRSLPFVEVQLGRRFRSAPHFELYLDYSYDAAISEYPFHTFGVGARTYLAHVSHYELYHQALASFAVSQGGSFRTIGDRLLGGFLTQGLGLELLTGAAWTVDVTVSTGYPVWLRGELAVKVRF